ncbi:hypothetical protein [Microbulbifer sp. 2205BS26-8]|uniref:hypothetical protein n=1 Tax=Microbulbifer sp. 2205BS26-8 TaxID=3064386 RepID=UPI00273E2B26|nr:hypothetical protein [Microbulbifer sp. 2205BS26-8]MDP5209681.1 hypothetical protein [Microbulbifer sp. 2205BS26-8]
MATLLGSLVSRRFPMTDGGNHHRVLPPADGMTIPLACVRCMIALSRFGSPMHTGRHHPRAAIGETADSRIWVSSESAEQPDRCWDFYRHNGGFAVDTPPPTGGAGQP